MSQQNVEIVRKAVDAFNSGDVGRIFALAHPDFEARIVPELSAEPDTYRGREGYNAISSRSERPSSKSVSRPRDSPMRVTTSWLLCE